MKRTITNIWPVLYPIFFYYVIAGFVFFALNLLMGEAAEIYMIKQLICSGATIPFLYALWKQDLYMEEVVYGKKEKLPAKDFVKQLLLVAAGMACLGVALNNVIVMLALTDTSTGFQEANEAFFAGNLWIEIAASCIVVPIAEEVLFRGVVLRRISTFAGKNIGLIFSAILFGLVHMNLVQFLYATILGMFLALIVLKSRSVGYAIVGHGAANLIAILRAETGIFDFAYEVDLEGSLFTAGALSLGFVLLGIFLGKFVDIREK